MPYEPKRAVCPEMTLSEVAEKLGVTKQAISVTERRAFRKLRAMFATHDVARELGVIDDAKIVELLRSVITDRRRTRAETPAELRGAVDTPSEDPK